MSRLAAKAFCPAAEQATVADVLNGAAYLEAAAALLTPRDERQVLRLAAEQARRLFVAEWAAILDLPRGSGRQQVYVAGLNARQFSDLARPWAASLQRLALAGRRRRAALLHLAPGVVGVSLRSDERRGLALVLDSVAERQNEQEQALAAYAKLVGLAWQQAQRHREDRARVQRQVERLNTAAEVGAAIGSIQSLDDVLDRIVCQTAAITGIKASTIVLADEQRQGFYIAATYGIDRRTTWISKERAATWQVILTGRPFEVLDGQADERFPFLQTVAREAGTHTCLSVPLVVRGQTIGSLDIHRSEVRHFSYQDLRLMQVLASQAAIAIENARLYSSIERERRLLVAIVQGMRDGLILEDEAGRVLYANQVACDLLGLTAESMRGADIAVVYRRLAELTASNEPVARQLLAAAHRHDQRAWIDVPLNGSTEADLRVRLMAASRGPEEPAWYLHLLHDVRWEHAAERAKSVLLSTVSHELRTPLTNIKGFVTSLLSPDIQWDPATQRDFLEEINTEADHLAALVDNLLDLSRLEAGVLQIRKRWTELAPLIQRVMRQVGQQAPGRRCTVSLQPNLPSAFVDPGRIGEVVRNLVENAVKYTELTNLVEVSVRCLEGQLLISVSDDGPGLPAGALEHIFERFYRYIPKGKQIAGTGLGLAICRGLVEAHGGHIWAESRPGAGTRVTFSLPLLGDHRPPEGDDLEELGLEEARQ